MTRRCSGPNCGAEVIFVPSAKTGRPMILDAEPKKVVVLILDRGPDTLVQPRLAHPGIELESKRAHVVDVYTPHHATCPDVKRFPRHRPSPVAPANEPDGGRRAD